MTRNGELFYRSQNLLQYINTEKTAAAKTAHYFFKSKQWNSYHILTFRWICHQFEAKAFTRYRKMILYTEIFFCDILERRLSDMRRHCI